MNCFVIVIDMLNDLINYNSIATILEKAMSTRHDTHKR